MHSVLKNKNVKILFEGVSIGLWMLKKELNIYNLVQNSDKWDIIEEGKELVKLKEENRENYMDILFKEYLKL